MTTGPTLATTGTPAYSLIRSIAANRTGGDAQHHAQERGAEFYEAKNRLFVTRTLLAREVPTFEEKMTI